MNMNLCCDMIQLLYRTKNFPATHSIYVQINTTDLLTYLVKLMKQFSVRPSVCPSVCLVPPAQKRHIFGVWLPWNTNRKPRAGSRTQCMVNMEGAEMATKPSSAPLKKHSLGGSTISMPLRTAIGGYIIVSLRDTLFGVIVAPYGEYRCVMKFSINNNNKILRNWRNLQGPVWRSSLDFSSNP